MTDLQINKKTKSHRSGFVNIIGNPNVGKSSLMNALVGEKLSIITAKAQTTRHRIMGIVNGTDFQIIYSDTPGIIAPAYKLQESMMSFVNTAMIDADIFLYVVEKRTELKNPNITKVLENSTIPIVLILNKIDLCAQEEVMEDIAYWQHKLPKANIIPASATENFNIPKILDTIVALLPPSPPYYDKEAITDKSERFFVGEIIREKILLNYQKEVPYSAEVEVESFKDTTDIINIEVVIYVARQTQKGIIIGHQGSMLKKVGTAARKDMESFFEKKVFLKLYVKVKKDWRNNETELKRFGYIQ